MGISLSIFMWFSKGNLERLSYTLANTHWELTAITIVASVVATFFVRRLLESVHCVRQFIHVGADPMAWSFWICAFSNNQFAVDHAIGEGGDVTSSSFATALQSATCKEVVALVDARGVIYQRIWCAFELFFARVMMPTYSQKVLPVLLVNEHGIVSYGDGAISAVDS